MTTPDDNGRALQLDTDIYLPRTRPPRRGYPLVVVFHGGASRKDNPFDAGHAVAFARRGYAVILYSQRGHGDSGGQVNVAGPQEMRDLFDVLAWAYRVSGRGHHPLHPDFRLDRRRIGLQGYSQGGLDRNLGQVWHGSHQIDPYGFAFRALEPGNTPNVVMQALVPNQVFKLTRAGTLFGIYAGTGKLGSAFRRWIVQAAADAPLYDRPRCNAGGHDTANSTIQQDLAFRSPGCFPARLTPPNLWSQAFDDGLFPPISPSRCGAGCLTIGTTACTCPWAATAPLPLRRPWSSTGCTRSLPSPTTSCVDAHCGCPGSSTGLGIPLSPCRPAATPTRRVPDTARARRPGPRGAYTSRPTTCAGTTWSTNSDFVTCCLGRGCRYGCRSYFAEPLGAGFL